jgi:hypothetical protein
VVLVGADGPFRGIYSMFLGWYFLILDVVLFEGLLEIIGAFVIENVKIGWMAVADENLMGGFLGVSDVCSLSIGNWDSMDGVCVLVIKNKQVIVPVA